MNDQTFQLKRALYTVVFLVLGAGLCAASELVKYVHSKELLAHLTRDVGIALLVGVYLMWTLERLNKLKIEEEVQDYIKTVGDNFIKAVYGKTMPSGLFDVIKTSLFEQHFVRTNYLADVTLHDFNERYINSSPKNVRELLMRFKENVVKTNSTLASNLVVFKTSSSFAVLNVSANEADYWVTWEIAKPLAGVYEGLCGITSVMVNRTQFVKDVILNTRPQDGPADSTVLRFSHRVSVPIGKSIQVSLEAYSLRSDDDNEPWQTLIPTQGMTVSVSDADGNKDIFLSLEAPSLVDGQEQFAEKDPNTNKATLAVTQYLLPYQGVGIKWTPSPARPPEPPAAN